MVAYWTLFTALKTATQVMAPVIPFMTEYIWQKLIKVCEPECAESVHLSDWPTAIPDFEDDGIIEETALARDVIGTAMRLRNEQQLKVRQPLNKLFVCCEKDKADKIKTFEKNILDELNIRNIEYIEDANLLEEKYVSVNFKVAGAVLKQNVNKMKQTLENLTADEMNAVTAEALAGGEVAVPGWDEKFDASVFALNSKTKAGIVSAEFGENAVLALDVVLTDELLKDGAVRDIIRQCQLLRKEAGYQVEQHIAASINTADEFILEALNEKKDYIANELLADSLTIGGDIAADLSKTFSVSEKDVTISVSKGE